MGLKNMVARLAILVVLLGCATAAKADTVSVDGSYGFMDPSGYAIPPYGGTFDGKAAQFYCVDFTHEISGGKSWDVTVTSLTASASAFSATLLKNQQTYLAMAWLITKMWGASSSMMAAEYQFAIWSFSGGANSPDPYKTNSSIVAAAIAAAKTFSGQGWEILTPTGSYGQEFLIYTSEPSVLLLLAVGCVLLVVVHKKAGV